MTMKSRSLRQTPVSVTRGPIALPTYLPAAPDKNPMFLDKRVYQGSSGKVYPLPFTDRIAGEKTDVRWDAVHIENEFIKLTILPQIGGRIHVGHDKTNGYDFFYRQEVIKPALVGLAGPWISGGVEFNWPQHHRPSTFMPADVEIEEHEDGSKTVWLGEHEPMDRMKGMHGVCLHPGKAIIEVKVRVYNRTELTQTFLWWANVAVRVHERYQSFFPQDARCVADHAKRSMSAFPQCGASYYGVDYKARAAKGIPPDEAPSRFVPPGDYPPNDLGWYANIPVPTSYMCMETGGDCFGGYDHAREAGVVHVANHHISPGKKQWTWGNHEFGYAWDRNLTDADRNGEFAPYIELMAGVYTDNQPDFSFLAPGETKTWSQFWYPIRKIGVPQMANLDAAVSLAISAARVRVGVCVSSHFPKAVIRVEGVGGEAWEWDTDLEPGKAFIAECGQPKRKFADGKTTLRVLAGDGREIISCAPENVAPGEVPPAATELPLPADIPGNDELYVAGLHLDQYRHATRKPELYWLEALRRDPGDARCNNAMGLWHLRRGQFADAEKYFRRAIARLMSRNPNPRDGEPYYNLGLALRHQGRDEEAYAAFYKATWNQAWQSAGFHAIAELDCRKGDWSSALGHLERALRANTDNLKARNLRAVVLRRLGRGAEADAMLRETLALDPLDWWARHLHGGELRCDTQARLDIALDYARAGLSAEAIALLRSEAKESSPGAAPLVGYYLGMLHAQVGDKKAAARFYKAAAKMPPDYCFPARLEEIAILQAAIAANPRDARAPYYLGNLLYDRGRREEAIALWEKSAKLDANFPTVWRNLGIAYFNFSQNPAKARAAYDKAFRANPDDARILYERDQLWKRTGAQPAGRLREFEKHPDLVRRRDDLSVELCALYNRTGHPGKALAILSDRQFQPWEGGEGQVLEQYTCTHLALGRKALASGDAAKARELFGCALAPPPNLGEARHLLASSSDVHYWLGVACDALGDKAAAKKAWNTAAASRGDFREMSVKRFSEMTYYAALSMRRLGKKAAAQKLLRGLLAHAKHLARTPAKIDYFATSLPAMLVFNDDLRFRQTTKALFLEAQAQLGLGRRAVAKKLLAQVLSRDPNHPLAAGFLAE